MAHVAPVEGKATADDLVEVDVRIVRRLLISIAGLPLDGRQAKNWKDTADQIGFGMNEHGEIVTMKYEGKQ